MFAIVRTGGKQYIVREGETIKVEKILADEGQLVNLDVLMLADEEGSDVKIGAPVVAGATVSARVLTHGREKKVSVVKYKPKSRYKRNVGHRQPFTSVKIESIKA